MRRGLGRRSLFFAGLVIVCVVLVPLMPPEFRWVAWFAAGLAAFWTILLSIEDLTRPSVGGLEAGGGEADMPFRPPPPPGG